MSPLTRYRFLCISGRGLRDLLLLDLLICGFSICHFLVIPSSVRDVVVLAVAGQGMVDMCKGVWRCLIVSILRIQKLGEKSYKNPSKEITVNIRVIMSKMLPAMGLLFLIGCIFNRGSVRPKLHNGLTHHTR